MALEQARGPDPPLGRLLFHPVLVNKKSPEGFVPEEELPSLEFNEVLELNDEPLALFDQKVAQVRNQLVIGKGGEFHAAYSYHAFLRRKEGLSEPREAREWERKITPRMLRSKRAIPGTCKRRNKLLVIF